MRAQPAFLGEHGPNPLTAKQEPDLLLTREQALILQFALWTSGGETIPKSFNFEVVFGSVYGTVMPRNGSFMEGNYRRSDTRQER
ncbi:hypothetical protein AS189_16460 [Arthrobacter alpinus]|uniref:Uncharacterized protein n=1 Tax=Arthrobacter alpinus TaxID=656366 RepID=A0A0S2M1Y3_9MICC|nr:hypothetical protein AS189_16460 [Arthrobacter alpinus]